MSACKGVNPMFPDLSQLLCLFFITFSAGGGGIFCQPLFSSSPLCPVLLLARSSTGHRDILSPHRHEISGPASITGVEFTAVHISNEICGVFVIQLRSLLWCDVRRRRLNSARSSNCHNMSLKDFAFRIGWRFTDIFHAPNKKHINLNLNLLKLSLNNKFKHELADKKLIIFITEWNKFTKILQTEDVKCEDTCIQFNWKVTFVFAGPPQSHPHSSTYSHL